MDNPNGLAKFCAEYRKQLVIAMNAYPAEYGVTSANDPPRKFPGRPEPTQTTIAEQTADNMCASFVNGSFNHDSRAIKATCKILGIRYTRGAILAYLADEPAPPVKSRK